MPACIHCKEPVPPSERQVIYVNGPVAHFACCLRQVIGSVAHQQHRCACYLKESVAGDPPELSQRQAAVAAVAYYFGDGGVHDDSA